MKIQIRKPIGETEFIFDIEKESEIEALAFAAFLATTPNRCGICGNQNVTLSSNRAQSYLFVKVKCLECNARASLGCYKDGGFFWKDWEKYSPQANNRT